jgi:peptidoglycan/xylan/chitin deacetylase (PgdA/CDA1 family)
MSRQAILPALPTSALSDDVWSGGRLRESADGAGRPADQRMSNAVSELSAEILKRFWLGVDAVGFGRRFNWPGGMVSFTFDDFPKSALDTGGAILEGHGARGTYYASFGLRGSQSDVGPLFEVEDLRQAHAFGHEVGCHTYNHINCAEAEREVLDEDVSLNIAALTKTLGGMPPTSFAFPFGAVSDRSRRALRPRYSSCRGIQPGLNRTATDLAELKANKIYDNEFDAARIRGLIDQARSGAWVIFYTHDVSENPSPWGCRPAQLEEAVAYAVGQTMVLPVGEVLRRAAPDRNPPSGAPDPG